MEPKILKLLQSGDAESQEYALKTLEALDPEMWCALLGYTNLFIDILSRSIDPGTINEIENYIKKNPIGIGTQVKYRGMEGAPTMLVVAKSVKRVPLGTSMTGGYTTLTAKGVSIFFTELQCRWFNRSKQQFETIMDRLECFQIIK